MFDLKKRVRLVLTEAYEDIEELKRLSNDILITVARENLDRFKEKNRFTFFQGLYLRSILEKFPDNYKKLYDFLKNTNIYVYFLTDDKCSKGGTYQTYDKEYRSSDERGITLYMKCDIAKEFDDLVKEQGEKLNSTDLYSKMYYKFQSILLHELQHAFDDFRSKGKTYQTKDYQKYKEKYEKEAMQDVAYDVNQAKSYLNLPHEIWARFSQAVDKIRFYSVDFIENGDNILLKFDMKPMENVLKNFISEFNGWKILNDSMKKKLSNKVIQFWHFEKDKIKKKNQEEQNKLKGN